MKIIQPKFVAIDSALLGKWAADACSEDKARQEKAAVMSEGLYGANWIPVLYWHHFEELARHAKLEVVENRIKFLLSLPLLGWISRADNRTEIIGAVVDLEAHEIKTFLSLGKTLTHSNEFIQSTRNSFLKFGKPSDIPMFSMWREFRPYLVHMGIKQQEIASICHSSESKYNKVPMSALNNTTNMSWDEAKQLYGEELAFFRDQIANKGDKRLSNPDELASRFCDLVFSNVANTSAIQLPPAEAFMKNFGFTLDDFPKDVTLGEFKEAVVRHKKLTSAISLLGLRPEDVWPTLRDHLLPSEEIVLGIRKSRINATRASGSDLNDDYHATLIPYLDAVVVDKRTHEHLRQAKLRNPEMPWHLKQVAKASFYNDIPEILKNLKKVA